MQDTPSPEQLLAAVTTFLRQDAGPALSRAGEGALAYQVKVAANMLDIARRQGLLAPAAEAAELARLRAVLGRDDGDLPTLNQALADALAEGRLGLQALGLTDHLWRTTLDKLAVDQPRYASHQRVLAAQAGLPAGEPGAHPR